MMEALLLKLLELLGENRANAFVDHLLKRKDPDLFQRAVELTGTRLNTAFQGIISFDAEKALLNPDVMKELKRFVVEPNDMSFEVLRAYLPKSTPVEFYDKLRDRLITELVEQPEFAPILKLSLLEYKSDAQFFASEKILGDTSEIKLQVNKILEILNAGKTYPPEPLPAKIKYTFSRAAIERTIRALTPSKESRKLNAAVTLIDLIKDERRVTLLSIAGMGKSTELTRLAAHYCAADQPLYPILIQLNLYAGESILEILSENFPRWQDIPPDRLLLIFDGLDEIADQHRSTFVRKLTRFSAQEEYRDARFVVSCRNNFYYAEAEKVKATLEGFHTFYLMDISSFQVQNFCRRQLGDERCDSFLSLIYQNNLAEILRSPFFLTILLDLYERDSILPSSRIEALELFIQKRIEFDQEHNRNKDVDLREYEVEIKNQISRVALIGEILGRNTISETELQQIINEKSTRDILKHTFLFNKNSQNRWGFEHNNFQEYLAAVQMKGLSSESIRRLVTFAPDFKKIKPSWVNTLSFLIQTIKDSSTIEGLIDWMRASEPTLIIQLEKDRIDLTIRESIVIAIIEHYHTRNIVTRSEYFDLDRLAKFVSESTKMVDYLIDKLRKSTKSVEVAEAALLLPEFPEAHKRKLIIEQLLVERATSNDLSEDARRCCLYSLAEFKCQSIEIIGKLISEKVLSESQFTRAGLYMILYKAELCDNYIEWILAQVSRTAKRSTGESNLTFGDESINLYNCVESITKPESIAKFLDFAGGQVEELDYHFQLVELLRKCIQKIKTQFPASDTLYGSLLRLHLNLSRRFNDDLSPEIKDYLVTTNRNFKAFEYMLNETLKSADDLVHNLDLAARIADQTCIEFFLRELTDGRLTDQHASVFRNCLNFSRSGLHDYYYNALNQLTGNKFLYEPAAKSWDQIHNDRYKRDLSLLSNVQLFKEQALALFEFEGKEVLTRWDMKEIRMNLRKEQEYESNVVPEFIRALTDQESVTRDILITRIDDMEKWEWFKVSTLLQYDIQGQIPLREEEIKWINAWCKKQLANANFKGALWIKDGETYYRHLEHYLAYFIRRFDFDCLEDILLELIWVDGTLLPVKHDKAGKRGQTEKLTDYLVRKVGLLKVKERVLRNLREGIAIQARLLRHIEICSKYRFTESIDIIMAAISGGVLNPDQKITAIKNFLELGGSLASVDKFIEQLGIDEHHRFLFLNLFKENPTPFLVNYMIEALNAKEISDSEKQGLANYLIQNGNIEGLNYYHISTVAEKRFPSRTLNKEGVLKMDGEKAGVLLMKMLEESMMPGFHKEWASDLDSTLVQLLVEYGSRSEGAYQVVASEFSRLIETYDARFLHYHLEALDRQFYLKKSQTYSVEDAITLISEMTIN